MNASQLLLVRHADVDAYADRFLSSEHAMLTAIPPGATTSLAWQWWHLTRTEDMGVNLLVGERPQLFDTDDWGARLGVARRDIGFGMTPEAVAQVTGSLALEELRAYRAAVSASTRDALAAMGSDAADSLPQERTATALHEADVARPELVDRLVRAFGRRSRAWLLSHFAVVHPFEHIGQCRMLRAMILRTAAAAPSAPTTAAGVSPASPASPGAVEAWLRGPVEGVPPLLQPVAHALLHAREDVERLVSDLSEDRLWARPAGLASIGFHLQHMSGVVDRLFSYARGDALTPAQLDALAHEGTAPPGGATVRALADVFGRTVERALEQLRTTDESSLTEARAVGRRALPSTVLGLLSHAAEHAQRHAGQLLVTVRVQHDGGS